MLDCRCIQARNPEFQACAASMACEIYREEEAPPEDADLDLENPTVETQLIWGENEDQDFDDYGLPLPEVLARMAEVAPLDQPEIKQLEAFESDSDEEPELELAAVQAEVRRAATRARRAPAYLDGHASGGEVRKSESYEILGYRSQSGDEAASREVPEYSAAELIERFEAMSS